MHEKAQHECDQNLLGYLRHIDRNTIFSKYVSIYLKLSRKWNNGSRSCIYKLTVKPGVSKITITIKKSNIQDYHLLWLELYGSRAGILNLTQFQFFLIVLLSTGSRWQGDGLFLKVWIRDQWFHCVKLNLCLFKVTDVLYKWLLDREETL